jgi:hypothetical protein
MPGGVPSYSSLNSKSRKVLRKASTSLAEESDDDDDMGELFGREDGESSLNKVSDGKSLLRQLDGPGSRFQIDSDEDL